MYEQGIGSDGLSLRDAYVVHEPVNLYFDGKDGMCRQEFAQECDINFLMRTYEKTGLPFNDKPVQFLDVSDVPDLQTAMTMLAAAEAAFMSLHATVRREFDNDALKFVAFAEDPANLERMREWGLAPKKPEAVGPIEVRVVPEPGSAPAKPASSPAPA